MGRFIHEADYVNYVNAEASSQGVPVALVNAIIGAESAFIASAHRPEPQINDASWGLMQLLYRTARGLGYSGDPSGLLDPSTNIHFGTMLLAQLLSRTNGDIAATASAYNGGYRPRLAFGAKATSTLTVCLAHDPTTGECIRSRTVSPGEYANQQYVDRVMSNYRYFLSQSAPQTPPDLTSPPTTGSSFPVIAASLFGGKFTVPILIGALGVLLLLQGPKRRSTL